MTWTVTPAQAEVLTAMTEHGCHKGAARALNRGKKTVATHLYNARARMGARTPTLAVLTWDRLLRSGVPLPVVQDKQHGAVTKRILRMASREAGTSSSEVARATALLQSDAASRLCALVRAGELRVDRTPRPMRYYVRESE
jgi:hypothetical protein